MQVRLVPNLQLGERIIGPTPTLRPIARFINVMRNDYRRG